MTVQTIKTQPDTPVQLHVMHNFGGGLEHWVRLYSKADASRINLVLKSIGTYGSFGRRLALYRHTDDETPIDVWNFHSPIDSTAVEHLEYQEALNQIIMKYKVNSIFVSSLIGHSLDILNTGLPTIKICHDYHPFCPAIYINLNGPCISCSDKDLMHCYRDNKTRLLYEASKSVFRLLRVRRYFIESIIKNSITLVTPADNVRSRFVQLVPSFKDARFVNIPHCDDFSDMRITASPPKNRETPRVLVLGRVSYEKGLELLKECYEDIASYADLYLVGCGSSGNCFKDKAGVHLVNKYRQSELVDIIEEVSPDLGLLLSVWPETFSYTLSELFSLGIPTLATDLGSFSERIIEGENGFLVKPEKGRVLSRLKELLDDKEALERVRENLRKCAPNTSAQMIAGYHGITPPPGTPFRYAPPKFPFPKRARFLMHALSRADTWERLLFEKTGLKEMERLFRQKLIRPVKERLRDNNNL